MNLDILLNPYVFLTFIMAILIFYSQWLDSPISLLKPLPGPKGWPGIGILPNLIASRFDLHDFHKRLAKRYGVIFTYVLFKRRVVVISDLQLLQEAFNNRNVSARIEDYMREKIAKRQNVGIISASGYTWEDHRPLVVNHLTKTVKSEQWESALVDETSKLTSAFASHNGSPFNCHRYLMYSAANALCYLLSGKNYGHDDSKLNQLVDALSRARENTQEILLSTFMPSLNFLPFGPVKKYISHNIQLVDFLSNLIEDCISQGDPSSSLESANFVEYYVNEMKEQWKKEVDDRISTLSMVNLQWTCFDLFTAGFDKTTKFLLCAIINMAVHPEIQSRVQEEIDLEIGRDRLPKLSDRPKLPYMEAFLLETHRLGHPPPLSLVHLVQTDTTVGCFEIPQGSLVFPNLQHLAHAAYAWRDPGTFRPERFINPDGSLNKRPQLMPFSTGMRMCPGEQLTASESFMFFSHIVHQFTLSMPDNMSLPLNPDGSPCLDVLCAGVDAKAVQR